MPTVTFKGQKIECEAGSNLRKTLLNNKLSPHNGKAKWLNCKGMGTCGTCAVKIKGVVNPKTWQEKWRLNFPPHHERSGLRLACQVKVWEDMEVEKGSGFWGQHI